MSRRLAATTVSFDTSTEIAPIPLPASDGAAVNVGSPGLGYSMAILSVVCNAVAIHMFRYALTNGTNAFTMVPLNSLVGLVCIMLLGIIWRRMGWRTADFHRLTPAALARSMHGAGWRLTLMLTAGALGGLLYTHAIAIYGADTVAFLGNGTVVLLVLAGLYQRERLNRLEAITIVMIIVGAFAFSYAGGGVMWMALGVMGLSCLGTCLKHLAVKSYAHVGGLGNMIAASMLHMGVVVFLIALALGTFHLPDPSLLGLIVLATVIGPVLGMTLLYGAYTIIGMSRGAPIDAMRPLAVLLISLSLGMADLSLFQTGGGLLMLAGSALLAAHGMRK